MKCFISVSDPVCKESVNPAIDGTVESGDLWACCKFTYAGNTIPWTKWTINSTRNATQNETVNSTGAVSTFTSMINMQVGSSSNGTLIIFEIIFDLHEMPDRARHSQNFTYEFFRYPAVNISCKYATNEIISNH